MLNLKSPKNLAPAGAGPAVIAVSVLLAGAATAAMLTWPETMRAPTRPNALFTTLGWFWLALGGVFWALSMARFLPAFRSGELATRGPFGWSRHPIYASLVFFWLPAVGLITESWAFYAVAVAAWLVAGAAGRKEEAELARVFGTQWTGYAARTSALLPLPRRKFGRVLVVLCWLGFAFTLLYAGALRPLHLGWGASADETRRPLAGDELVPHPQYRTTHAIFINAPPERVWPWLAQMGWGRGGLYSYERLENLFGCRMKNADSIIPALQAVQPDDTFRMDPRIPALRFAVVDPPRALVISDYRRPGEPQVAWQFIVEPAGTERSRLIVRWQSTFPPGFLSELFNKTLLEPISFIMEERMLRGIKERAERRYTRGER